MRSLDALYSIFKVFDQAHFFFYQYLIFCEYLKYLQLLIHEVHKKKNQYCRK